MMDENHHRASNAPPAAPVGCAPVPAPKAPATKGVLPSAPPANSQAAASTADAPAPRSSGDECRVRVAVRIRPLLSLEDGQEESTHASSYHDSRRQSVSVGGAHKFTFDHVFDQRSTQDQVYSEAVGPLVGEVVSGYNVTVMAYGQTGSGKTFTMGTSGEHDEDLEDSDNEDSGGANTCSDDPHGERGMTPRCIADLFNRLDAAGLSYEVSCSVLELYKDELRDLQRGGEYLEPGQQLRI
eukprot:g4823.t1